MEKRSNMVPVSVVILNWNGLKDTIDCLESLKKINYTDYRVLVVDNASKGNDADLLETKYTGYVTIIRSAVNLGCGGGYNLGLRYALEKTNAAYVVIMNNDVLVDANYIDEMVKAAEADKTIGLIGPKIYYLDYQGRKDIIWSAGGTAKWWLPSLFQQVGEGAPDSPQYDLAKECDWMAGTVLMVSREAVMKAGYYDPWYFYGYEDIDFCLRIKNHGFKLLYLPSARVWHKIAASARGTFFSYFNIMSYYYLIKKVFSTPIFVFRLIILPVVLFRWGVIFLFKYRKLKMFTNFFKDALNISRLLRAGKQP